MISRVREAVRDFFVPVIWVIVLITLYIRHTPYRVNQVFWKIGSNIETYMLEGNNRHVNNVVKSEIFRKNFVSKYMADQGFGIPAVTSVVLRNGYQSAIAVHFFANEHMKIDYENNLAEPVYTNDLLQTDYYISEPQNE